MTIAEGRNAYEQRKNIAGHRPIDDDNRTPALPIEPVTTGIAAGAAAYAARHHPIKNQEQP